MFVTGGIALLIITAFGLFSGNGNFAVTALYIFIFAIAAAVVYTAVKGADTLRKNLLHADYRDIYEKQGYSRRRFLFFKLLQSWLAGVLLVTEYVLFLGMMLVLAEKKFSGNRDMSGFLDRMKEGAGVDFGFGTMFLVYLELSGICMAVTALCFLAFSLCYKFFLRYKYAFGASLLTSLTMFWVAWKIFDFTVPVKGIMSIAGALIYALVLCAVLTCILLLLADKLFEDESARI